MFLSSYVISLSLLSENFWVHFVAGVSLHLGAWLCCSCCCRIPKGYVVFLSLSLLLCIPKIKLFLVSLAHLHVSSLTPTLTLSAEVHLLTLLPASMHEQIPDDNNQSFPGSPHRLGAELLAQSPVVAGGEGRDCAPMGQRPRSLCQA